VLTIRLATEQDRESILEISRDVGVFTPEEVAVVDELLDIYLHEHDNHEYIFIVASDESGCILGYDCYGPTAMTDSTYDMYWLAVSKASQGRGVGKALMEHVERTLRAQGARLIVLETSGTPEYEPTRRFHEHCGYTGRLAVPDFYRQGDDLIVYSKPLR